jgi:toxin FitB
VVSEAFRKTPAPAVVSWLAETGEVALSAITLHEIYFGLTVKPAPMTLRAIEAYVEAYCRVLDVTANIARHAGTLRGQLARHGRVRDQADMLIAATAAAHGLTLATRNTRDFDGCGIALHDPFS